MVKGLKLPTNTPVLIIKRIKNGQSTKQTGLHDVATVRITSEVAIGLFCHHTTTRRTFDKALHDEEWLVNLLDGTRILSYSRRYGSEAYRPAFELVDDGKQYLVVYLVKTKLVDVQRCERQFRNVDIDAAIAPNLSKVANTTQQSIGNTWRATRTTRYLDGCLVSIDAERLMIFCSVSGS